MTTMAVSSSEVFDVWAQVYDEQPNPLLALEQRFLRHMLPDIAGLDVLDAGCGTGRWLQLLTPHRPATLVGVDASPQMLERAATKLGTSATLRQGSCNTLPVQNAAIDSVLASFVLSYLDDLDVFARELLRIMRPGATAFLTDMHPETATSRNWKRSFRANGTEEHIQTSSHSLKQITDTLSGPADSNS